MKVRNEVQHISVSDHGGQAVEGIVRVRGVDARVRGRGFVIEQQQPVGVVVRSRFGVQRLTLPREDSLSSVAVALAGPALFLATKRFFRKGRRR